MFELPISSDAETLGKFTKQLVWTLVHKAHRHLSTLFREFPLQSPNLQSLLLTLSLQKELCKRMEMMISCHSVQMEVRG